MTSAPKTRPVFLRPPVKEVAATIQFSDLDGVSLLCNLPEYWKLLGKKQYPTVEFKRPKPKLSAPPELAFAVLGENDDYQAPRVWFLSADKTSLVQLQSDRLSFNWRQLDKKKPAYSSYDFVWKSFSGALRALAQFSQKHLEKTLEADFLELLYINTIPFTDFGGAARINKCIPSISWETFPKSYLGDANVVNFMWETPIGEDRSSLRVQGLTGSDLVSGEAMLRLDIQQVGAISANFDNDTKKIHNWFDDAHLRIVNTFKDMTSAEMHKKWGLKDETTTH